MNKGKIYFALWADDINRYLNTCFNCDSLSEIRNGILDYISIDQDNPKAIQISSVCVLLKMTGLELDSNSAKFDYKDILDEEPTSIRTGQKVQECYLF